MLTNCNNFISKKKVFQLTNTNFNSIRNNNSNKIDIDSSAENLNNFNFSPDYIKNIKMKEVILQNIHNSNQNFLSPQNQGTKKSNTFSIEDKYKNNAISNKMQKINIILLVKIRNKI